MSQDSDIRLGELAALCKRQRQGTRQPRYDEEAKALVRELAASGVEKEAIARASGVSANAIWNWLKGPAVQTPARQRPVKILKVEDNGGAPEQERLGGGDQPEQGRMVMMIRVSDFDVAIYSRDGGPP